VCVCVCVSEGVGACAGVGVCGCVWIPVRGCGKVCLDQIFKLGSILNAYSGVPH
jgi:hypothetical protein